ncbi:YbhB/YbcL family Raf kinase inhibitor-like protein [Nonomuraea sp. N2-4H]|uniref:YbhB/YbcL family Raf kinase inhibitor-like protein n=1 Tax=Nonomuraea sp. N2-4H TaxID=3128898 RepID=UPI00387385BF
MPREYSCKGDQGSPPLRWSSQPLSEARSIAIVVDSHTGSDSAVHWVIYNIPATTTELGPNAAADPPEGSGQAKVTSGREGYEPPCEEKAGVPVHRLHAERQGRARRGPGASADPERDRRQDHRPRTTDGGGHRVRPRTRHVVPVYQFFT